MTLRRQLLLIALVHVLVVLAAWDGYRIGYKRGLGERLRPQASIQEESQVEILHWRGEWKKYTTYSKGDVVKDSHGHGLIFVAMETNKNDDPMPSTYHEKSPWTIISSDLVLQREKWDANWRLN